MPDLENRTAYEDKVTRVVAKHFARNRKKVMELIGFPPDAGRLTKSFWGEFSQELEKELQPVFEDLFVEGAQGLVKEIGLNAPTTDQG